VECVNNQGKGREEREEGRRRKKKDKRTINRPLKKWAI
jgi:hypothetical protein